MDLQLLNKTSIVTLIYLLLLLQIPFQDFYLSNTVLGQFGSNISILFLNLLFLVFLVSEINDKKINLKWVIFVVFLLIISLIGLSFTGDFAKGQTLWLKLLKNVVFYSQPLIVFFVFNSFFKKYPFLIGRSIQVSTFIFIVFFGYLLLESYEIFSLDSNNLLHGTENSNARPRLFSQESSMGAVIYTTFGIIATLQYSLKIYKIFIFILLIWGVIILQSKGTLIVLLVLSAIYFSSKLKVKVLLPIAVLVFLAIVGYFFQDYLIKVTDGFQEYTSFSTRVTMLVAGVVSLFLYPFGTGLGTYIVYFDDSIILAKEMIVYLFSYIEIPPVFSEIDTYFETSKAYSTKTMFFNLIMLFGVFGVFVFYKLHKYVYMSTQVASLRFLFWYLIVMETFFVDSLYLYEFWFAYAFMYNYQVITLRNKVIYG